MENTIVHLANTTALIIWSVLLVALGAGAYYVVDRVRTTEGNPAGLCADIRGFQGAVKGLNTRFKAAEGEAWSSNNTTDLKLAIRRVAGTPVRLPPGNNSKAKKLYEITRDEQAA